MISARYDDTESALEMARLVRECEERVRAKLAAQQMGELFYDLPPQGVSHDRHHESNRA